MACSRYGLHALEHLPLPVDLRRLRAGVCRYHDDIVFEREVRLIPGLRTVPERPPRGFGDMAAGGNLRGEEVEAFGLLARLGNPGGRLVLVLPGSHTQFLFIENGAVVDILSVLTGELYQALTSATVLADAVTGCQEADLPAVAEGYELLNRYGVNRALYLLHASNVFGVRDAAARRGALDGIVEGGAADALAVRLEETGFRPERAVVAGKRARCTVYNALLAIALPELRTECLLENSKMPLSVLGLLELAGEKREDELDGTGFSHLALLRGGERGTGTGAP